MAFPQYVSLGQALGLQSRQIRHSIVSSDGAETSTWTGVYRNNTIEWRGTRYEYPSTFAKEHYRSFRPDRTTNIINGWEEVEVQIDGVWRKLSVLRQLYILMHQ